MNDFEHDRAVALAELLARTLGPDWTSQVWENLGWHYAATSPCGRLTVHPGSGAGFTAFLGAPGGVGGRWAEYGKTPQKAIDNTVAAATAEYNEIGSIIEGLMGRIPDKTPNITGVDEADHPFHGE